MDPIAHLKNGGRVAVATALAGLARTQEAADGFRQRALRRVLLHAGLATRADLARLAHAVSELDRATLAHRETR